MTDANAELIILQNSKGGETENAEHGNLNVGCAGMSNRPQKRITEFMQKLTCARANKLETKRSKKKRKGVS